MNGNYYHSSFYNAAAIITVKSFIAQAPGAKSGIQTLDLRMISRVFYHCATVSQYDFIRIDFKSLFEYSLTLHFGQYHKTFTVVIISVVW